MVNKSWFLGDLSLVFFSNRILASAVGAKDGTLILRAATPVYYSGLFGNNL